MISAAARKLTMTRPMPIADDATPFQPQPMAAAMSKIGATGIARRARSRATCNSGAGPATGCDRASFNTIGHLSQTEALLMSLHVGDVTHVHLPDYVAENDEEEYECEHRRSAESTIE